MRTIEIEPGLRIRFPGRNMEFAQGVEMGMVIALMAQGAPSIVRSFSEDDLEQLRAISEKFGYLVDARDVNRVTLTRRGIRPVLRLVESR